VESNWRSVSSFCDVIALSPTKIIFFVLVRGKPIDRAQIRSWRKTHAVALKRTPDLENDVYLEMSEACGLGAPRIHK
jgi:hypothetical protein